MLLERKTKTISGNGFAFLRFGAWKHPAAVIRKTFPAKYLQEMHFHDFPQVWYCNGGRYLHQVGQNVYDCTAGSFFVIPPGVDHGFVVPEGCEADLFCIEVKYSLFMDAHLEQCLNAASNLMLPCFHKELDFSFSEHYVLSPESQEKAQRFLSDLAMLNFVSGEENMDMIFRCLECVFSLPELAIPQRCYRKALRLAEQKALPIVRTIIYINENYSQKVSAEDLMWVAALCHTDFYKCFKRFVGLTYTDYLLQLRLTRVDVLLQSTTYSFGKIAELCGFSDAAHMSKCYKRLRGYLLKDARKKIMPPKSTVVTGVSNRLRDARNNL